MLMIYTYILILIDIDTDNNIYFDVYNSYIDNNGFLSKKLSDGNVHIRNGVYLQNFINNYLL